MFIQDTFTSLYMHMYIVHNSALHNHVSFNGSMSKLTRLQRHVTTWMSDLCWVCQQNSTAIMRAANQPEEEKSTVSIHANVAV